MGSRSSAEMCEAAGVAWQAREEWAYALRRYEAAAWKWAAIATEEKDAEAHRRSSRCWRAAAAACDRLADAADEKAEALEGVSRAVPAR
jgi:hypothetical protein